jgi:transcriptional regulator
MPEVEKIVAMNAEGFSNKEIADKLSTEEEPLTYQAVAKIVKASNPEVVKAEIVVPSGIVVRSAQEYADYSESQGRTKYGGEKGVKVPATIEELRAFINSGWKPSMLMEKWQFNEAELVTLVHALAKSELRERAPVVNLKQDFFRF